MSGRGFCHLTIKTNQENNTEVAQEVALDQALSSQNPTAIDPFIPIYGETELLYKCLNHGSLCTLEAFLSLNVHLKKESIELTRALNSCLQHGVIGLDMLRCLYTHSLMKISKEKNLFMPNGRYFLSHIINKLKEESEILLYLIYFTEVHNFPANVPDNTEKRLTPLHRACRYGYLSLVKWLIEMNDVDPRFCLKGQQYPISHAATEGYLHIVKYLVENQGVPLTLSDKDRFGYTVFHWACQQGHLALVKWLIEEKNMPPDYCQPNKHSPFNQAATRGHKHILEYLINQGVSPTFSDKDDLAYTPLHWASQEGHLSLIKWLIPLYVRKKNALNFSELIKLARTHNKVAVVEYFVCDIGCPSTEAIELFLKKHGCRDTLKTLKEIKTIEGFLARGHNPFFSVHRLNQVRANMNKDKFEPFLEKISRWHTFINHQKFDFLDKFVFKRDLNRLHSILVLKSS